ncbi:MAG: hypothetical protein ACOCYT_04950 [Chloroflexota bacterium]
MQKKLRPLAILFVFCLTLSFGMLTHGLTPTPAPEVTPEASASYPNEHLLVSVD